MHALVSGNLAELRHRRARPRILSAASPSIKSPPSTSARTRRFLHSKSPPKAAASRGGSPAIAITGAATAGRSRSAPLRRRFRWKSTRESFSSGSSVRAIRPRSAKQLVKQYGSILDQVSEEAAESAAQSRRAGPAMLGRLSGNRSRNRAARSEDGEAGYVST